MNTYPCHLPRPEDAAVWCLACAGVGVVIIQSSDGYRNAPCPVCLGSRHERMGEGT